MLHYGMYFMYQAFDTVVFLALFFFFKQKTAYEMLRSLVGSEMCIRDRSYSDEFDEKLFAQDFSSSSEEESDCEPQELFDDVESPRCEERMDWYRDEDQEGYRAAVAIQRAWRASKEADWSVSPAARNEILKHLEATQIRLETAQEVLSLAEDEKLELEDELGETIQNNEDLQEDNLGLWEENELVEAENQRLVQRLVDCERENDQLKAENDRLARVALVEQDLMKDELAGLQAENARLTQLVNESQETHDDLIDGTEGLREEMELQENQELLTREQLRIVGGDLHVARSEIQQLQNEIRSTVEEQELELDDLTQCLEQAETEADLWRRHAQELLVHVSELLQYRDEIEEPDAKPTEMLEATIEHLRNEITSVQRRAHIAEGAAQVLAQRSPRSESEIEGLELQNQILVKRMSEYEAQLLAHREELVHQMATPDPKSRFAAEPDTPYDEVDVTPAKDYSRPALPNVMQPNSIVDPL
eukprot:TRINITY_DN24211_c0_g1_i4.p1 TRINITY_DN24211_c0_g1~~TRINITY_DN24211_c0_g1_i4.p1  ORF type:complete len:476 (-),score=145.85 TRINITY_DN24211_c0_g1_i4:235-1662(-)